MPWRYSQKNTTNGRFDNICSIYRFIRISLAVIKNFPLKHGNWKERSRHVNIVTNSLNMNRKISFWIFILKKTHNLTQKSWK